MNYMKMKWSIAFVALALTFWNCDSDDDKVQKYGSGVYAISEGNFGSANGSVTYYNPDKDETLQAIYKTVNGAFPGDVLQSLKFNSDEGYLVLNGSNKIEIINSETFKNEGTITADEIVAPRDITIINGKAYISVWGPYNESYQLVDSYIAVVDLSTKEVTTTIDTDEGVERLLYNGTYLFASNFNYGSSNTLAVIDPSDNSLETQIELGAGPKGLVLDANEKLWVITTGNYLGNDGQLFRINPSTLEIEETIELGINPDGELALSPNKETLIFNTKNVVYKLGIAENDIASATSFTAEDVSYAYGLGVDPDSGDIYMGDALSFTSAGTVYVYSSEGVSKTSFTAGIGPSGFAFR